MNPLEYFRNKMARRKIRRDIDLGRRKSDEEAKKYPYSYDMKVEDRGLRTPYPNSLTINQLGLRGSPFPLSATFRQDVDGVFHISLFPLSVQEIADLLLNRVQDTCAVFDVDLHSYCGSHQHSLEEVLEELEVSHDRLRPNCVTLSKSGLEKLIGEVGHYNFHMIDLPTGLGADDIAEMRPILKDHDQREAMLPKVHGSRVFLDTHDDCYLYVESRDVDLLYGVFARLMQIYFGTLILRDRGSRPVISNVPLDEVSDILPAGSSFTALRENFRFYANRLMIAYSDVELEFTKKKEYPPVGVVEYDVYEGVWSHRPA